tara:strand:+ start:1114 stop:1320 length:207 start_codon:yes stop_codon:yes gene_type:complete
MRSDLITIREGIEYCAIRGVNRSRYTFYRWIDEEKLEAYEVGGRIHISREALKELVISKRVEIRAKNG